MSDQLPPHEFNPAHNLACLACRAHRHTLLKAAKAAWGIQNPNESLMPAMVGLKAFFPEYKIE